MRRTICSNILAVCTSSLTSDSGIATRNVSTSPGFVNPGWTFPIAWKVRIISPEATSRITASAISATTSVLRARWRSRPALESRPPSLSADASCGRANFRIDTLVDGAFVDQDGRKSGCTIWRGRPLVLSFHLHALPAARLLSGDREPPGHCSSGSRAIRDFAGTAIVAVTIDPATTRPRCSSNMRANAAPTPRSGAS